MLVKTRNLLDLVAPITYLANPTASGGTAFAVKNISQFTANWGVQLGKTGEETAEILILSSSTPSGTALNTTGTARFDHPTDTPMYAIKYDQVVFERSTAGTAGTATPLSNGTVSIAPDSTFTFFEDTSGQSTYAYKTYFRASVLGLNSTESDWITPAGFTFWSKAKLRQRIRSKLFDSSFIPNDSDIDDWINEWLEVMTNAAIDVNKDYALGTVDIGYSGTTQLGTITASDYKDVRKVLLTYDGGVTWRPASKKDLTGFDPTQLFSQANPHYFFQGDNIIGRLPYDTDGTARLSYYKLNPVLVNDADELPVAMHSYTKSFVDYGEGQARKKDGKMDDGVVCENNAKLGLARFTSQITPRSESGPVFVDVNEPVDGQDNI